MILDSFRLDGKIAAVTGPTRGIGKAIALGLAEAGADIALLQRSPNNDDVQKEIKQMGRNCTIIPCDLENPKQVGVAIPNVINDLGQIDILVNNAGIQRRSPSVDFTETDWDDVLNVNLKTVWLLSQQAGRHMVEKNKGKIINIGSLQTFQGGYTIPAYAAAKGGVGQLTKALANEWAQHHVNVNSIAPGYMATDMNEAIIHDEIRSREIMGRIPAKRWGQTEDLKGAAVFLASAASDYVHGHILTVDGGWMGR